MDIEPPINTESPPEEKTGPRVVSKNEIAVTNGNYLLKKGIAMEKFQGDDLQLWRPVMDELEESLQKDEKSAELSTILDKFKTKNTSLPFWNEETFTIVIRELLVNAVRAIQEQPVKEGVIDITSRIDEEKGVFVISVADDGPGLQPLDKKKIFEEGCSTKETQVFRDTIGNGLYRSKMFVEQLLDGNLEAFDNQADLGEQRGATFVVTLPLK